PSLVFFKCFSEDKYVVHINTHPSLGDLISEYVIHHCLKGCRRVCESEELYQWFKYTVRVLTKGHFPFVTILDPDIIVPPPDVHF
ncbi:hypothetical protein AMATHDRAFT_143859, partial [Amanita thiersii Skay4041]